VWALERWDLESPGRDLGATSPLWERELITVAEIMLSHPRESDFRSAKPFRRFIFHAYIDMTIDKRPITALHRE
jgi:hypothetical protein